MSHTPSLFGKQWNSLYSLVVSTPLRWSSQLGPNPLQWLFSVFPSEVRPLAPLLVFPSDLIAVNSLHVIARNCYCGLEVIGCAFVGSRWSFQPLRIGLSVIAFRGGGGQCRLVDVRSLDQICQYWRGLLQRTMAELQEWEHLLKVLNGLIPSVSCRTCTQ